MVTKSPCGSDQLLETLILFLQSDENTAWLNVSAPRFHDFKDQAGVCRGSQAFCQMAEVLRSAEPSDTHNVSNVLAAHRMGQALCFFPPSGSFCGHDSYTHTHAPS